MLRYASQAELAPRDIVARAILSEMLAEKTDCQYLDLRHLPAEKMHARFPTISAICHRYGLDLASDLLPIAPAAHYCMGGVMVDTHGRTTLPGLYAVGEAACTGVHGANRLASNSLLEGLVFGLRLADGLAARQTNNHPAQDSYYNSPVRHAITISVADDSSEQATPTNIDSTSISRIRHELRGIMWQYVSLCRDQAGLLEAKHKVRTLRQLLSTTEVTGKEETADLVQWAETRNMLQIAELVIAAALQRCESRGSHWRSDYKTLDESLANCHYAFVRETSALTLAYPRREVIAHA
jgi:L-aspartate oxidase